MADYVGVEAYPLTWPSGRPRMPPARRRTGNFSAGFTQSRDEMLHELKLLRAHTVIVSTNVPLRRDGLPMADAKEPADPGVAVYFKRSGRDYVLACDAFTRVKANLRAIGKTVEALRAIERHGTSEMMEQAFTGFAALPPARAADASWWETLGVAQDAPLDAVKARYRELAQLHHPDRGGDAEMMARVNRAYETACEVRRG